MRAYAGCGIGAYLQLTPLRPLQTLLRHGTIELPYDAFCSAQPPGPKQARDMSAALSSAERLANSEDYQPGPRGIVGVGIFRSYARI